MAQEKNNEQKKWDNITSDVDLVEAEQVKVSSTYELNPDLLNHTFIAKPVTRKKFGGEVIKLAVKLHPNWLFEIELQESEQTFVKLCGMDKEYSAKVAKLNSRKKGREDKQYIGVSINVEEEIINASFQLDDFKNLKKIGFIKSVG